MASKERRATVRMVGSVEVTELPDNGDGVAWRRLGPGACRSCSGMGRVPAWCLGNIIEYRPCDDCEPPS